MSIALRRRGVGENLALTWILLFRNFGRILILTLLFALPVSIPQVLAAVDPMPWIYFDENGMPVNGADALSALLFLLFLPMFLGSVIGIVSGSYTGQKVSILGSLGLALRKFFPLVSYGILLYILLTLSAMLFILPLTLLGVDSDLRSVLVFLPLIPNMLLFSMFYVGVPAIVAENLGVFGGFVRSQELTKGHLWGILGFQLLVAMSIFAVFVIVGLFSGIVSVFSGGPSPSDGQPLYLTIVIVVLMGIGSLVAVIAPVVMYFQLRAIRGSFDLASVAQLVDRIGQRRLGDRREFEDG